MWRDRLAAAPVALRQVFDWTTFTGPIPQHERRPEAVDSLWLRRLRVSWKPDRPMRGGAFPMSRTSFAWLHVRTLRSPLASRLRHQCRGTPGLGLPRLRIFSLRNRCQFPQQGDADTVDDWLKTNVASELVADIRRHTFRGVLTDQKRSPRAKQEIAAAQRLPGAQFEYAALLKCDNLFGATSGVGGLLEESPHSRANLHAHEDIRRRTEGNRSWQATRRILDSIG